MKEVLWLVQFACTSFKPYPLVESKHDGKEAILSLFNISQLDFQCPKLTIISKKDTKSTFDEQKQQINQTTKNQTFFPNKVFFVGSKIHVTPKIPSHFCCLVSVIFCFKKINPNLTGSHRGVSRMSRCRTCRLGDLTMLLVKLREELAPEDSGGA